MIMELNNDFQVIPYARCTIQNTGVYQIEIAIGEQKPEHNSGIKIRKGYIQGVYPNDGETIWIRACGNEGVANVVNFI